MQTDRSTIATNANIFLYLPNLIGYVRIILNVIGFYYIQSNYIVAATCYIIVTLLDTVDGYAAKRLNQCTKFGEILHQLTDRCGLIGLLVALSHFYAKYMFLFQLSMVIDVAGHWMYMHAMAIRGRQTHKITAAEDFWIIRLYYKTDILTVMVYGNQIFYLAMYALHFSAGPMVFGLCCLFEFVAIATAPIACLKIVVSFIHGIIGANELTKIDYNKSLVMKNSL